MIRVIIGVQYLITDMIKIHILDFMHTTICMCAATASVGVC